MGHEPFRVIELCPACPSSFRTGKPARALRRRLRSQRSLFRAPFCDASLPALFRNLIGEASQSHDSADEMEGGRWGLNGGRMGDVPGGGLQRGFPTVVSQRSVRKVDRNGGFPKGGGSSPAGGSSQRGRVDGSTVRWADGSMGRWAGRADGVDVFWAQRERRERREREERNGKLSGSSPRGPSASSQSFCQAS